MIINRTFTTVMLSRIVLIVVFYSWSITSLAREPSTPYILDFYPDCEYQLLESTTIKTRTHTPAEQDTIDKLLSRITRQAVDANADAIILTKRHYKAITGENKNLDGSRQKTYLFGFDAEFIKLCENKSKLTHQRTPFNHKGRASEVALKFQTISTPQLVIDLESKRPKRLKHSIKQWSVSGSGHFYGSQLGRTIDQVRQVMGDPAIKLILSDGTTVLGYGRHHWLYFQNDLLVTVSTKQNHLSMEGVNKIPHMDSFDEKRWLIEGKYGYKAEWNHHVSKTISKHQNYNLEMELSKPDSNTNVQYIAGYSLAAPDTTRKISTGIRTNQAKQWNLKGLTTVKNSVDKVITQPVGVIYDGNKTVHYLLDAYTLLTTRSSKLRSMEMSESMIQGSTDKPGWEILGFSYGETYEEASKKFTGDFIDTGYEVYIPYDGFELKLEFYDDVTDKILYKATVTF